MKFGPQTKFGKQTIDADGNVVGGTCYGGVLAPQHSAIVYVGPGCPLCTALVRCDGLEAHAKEVDRQLAEVKKKFEEVAGEIAKVKDRAHDEVVDVVERVNDHDRWIDRARPVLADEIKEWHAAAEAAHRLGRIPAGRG